MTPEPRPLTPRRQAPRFYSFSRKSTAELSALNPREQNTALHESTRAGRKTKHGCNGAPEVCPRRGVGGGRTAAEDSPRQRETPRRRVGRRQRRSLRMAGGGGRTKPSLDTHQFPLPGAWTHAHTSLPQLSRPLYTCRPVSEIRGGLKQNPVVRLSGSPRHPPPCLSLPSRPFSGHLRIGGGA